MRLRHREKPAPPLLDLMELPRGLGMFDADELEELILAIDDRLDIVGEPFRRARLLRVRGTAERELGRLVALAVGN